MQWLWGQRRFDHMRRSRGVVGLGDGHGRFGGGNGPLTIDTWPHHQIICMRAQLFISNSSVSLSRQTFTNNFF